MYREKLNTGGELCVSKDDWFICYIFIGINGGRKGEKIIYGRDIKNYINAWVENFNKYDELKKTNLQGKSVSIDGKCGMRINVGGFNSGIHMGGYYLCTEEHLYDLVADYEYAEKRALEIQKSLK